jgi:hypothetical protein
MSKIESTVEKILDIEQGLEDIDYLKEVAKSISKNLSIKFVLIGYPVEESYEKIQTNVVWAGDQYLENFVYDLDNTPCNSVMCNQKTSIHENNLTDAFPTNELLKQMGVSSYLGTPIQNAKTNGMSGILALIDDKPIEQSDFLISVLESLSSKITPKMKSVCC